MGTDNANKSNAARRTKATTKTGLVSLLVLCLLTEGYAKTTLNLPTKFRRQVDEEEQAEDDFGTILTRFLTADAETQQDYIRYGLELAEYHLLESYDGVKDKTDETDRVFLESVQSVIDAVRQINTDPARTPTALAELATNPDNLLLFTSLVVTTVFVAQLSSFVLFGTSLSAPLQENTEAGPVSGLLGIMMELFNIFPNLFAAFAELIGNIARGSEDEADDDEDDAEDTTNVNKFFIDPTDEDAANDADGEDEEEDMEEGSGEAPGGLFDPILNILASIFPPTRDGDGDAEEGSGSGDGEVEEEDNDIHIGVDVEPGSLLDMIINLIPGEEERDENAEDTTEMDGGEVTTLSPEQGGPTFGGISVSLAPIDLANIFVQVQQIVGMNCTCSEGMTEEMITNTTMRLLNESLEEAKRMRLYSSLDTSSYSSLNDEDGGSKKDGARSRAPKRGKLSEKKKTKKGGRKKMWQPRTPKSLK